MTPSTSYFPSLGEPYVHSLRLGSDLHSMAYRVLLSNGHISAGSPPIPRFGSL